MVMKENNDLKKTITIIKRSVVCLRFTITMVVIIYQYSIIIISLLLYTDFHYYTTLGTTN